MRSLTALVVLVALAAGVSAAQDRPNFTGDWELDLKSSQLHEDFRALERGVVRIDHREPAFTFRRTFFFKGKPVEATYEVTTDGREHSSPAPGGGVGISKMQWDNMALVVEQRIAHPQAGQLINKVRYELIDQGRTLRSIEDFEGGGRSHHNVWIFRRQ